MLEQIDATAAFLKERLKEHPKAGIILGTGLGNFAREIEVSFEIPYREIPNFPVSTVEGHSGKLIAGRINGVSVVAMQGRFHYYEGYDMNQVVFPVRVMKRLGINYLLLSNASGGVNENFSIGDLMIIRDHINLFPTNPLMGKNDNRLGTRFPDMSDAYCADLVQAAEEIASANDIAVQKGVYAGLSGPTLETPAEYKYIRIIGADAVGMSTVPEVIAARHMGMKCFAMSIITDLGVEGKIQKTTHEDVQREAQAAEPKMAVIFKNLLPKLE